MLTKRKSKCKICRTEFVKLSMSHKACSPDCALQVVMQANKRKEAAEARKVRSIDKVRAERLKSRSDWMREAQQSFNRYIRARDENKPCICCGRTETKVTGLGAHGWDSGHYRSVGSAPHLRFNENNVHRQLVYCNRYGAGRAVDYRIGLIARIGLQAVEELEADSSVKKYSIDDLKQIKELYKRKLRDLKTTGQFTVHKI